jgi:Dyp-type peroxidase family
MRPAADTAAVDLADLQGNVLRGYGFPHAAYLLARVEEPAVARGALAALLPRVTNAEPWTAGKPEVTLNLAFTAAGLSALGVPVDGAPDDFREGMAARSEQLGDTGRHAPETWEEGLRGGAHVLVMLNGRDAASLDAEVAALREALAGALAVVHEQRAAALDGNREHFGFSDGFSQPAIQGDGVIATPGQGTPEKDGRWSELPLGEFLLGHDDGDHRQAAAPAGPLGRNATYMVYRKLRQDVALFRATLRRHAGDGGEELLAAQIVGRWRDGTPLMLSPDGRPVPPERMNDFRYGDDPDGRRCPIGAHIRRANPRDGLGWHGTRTRRHRMIRRGMPYGPPLPPQATEDDGTDRGLIFVCFCASLARQFETVQSQWCGDGNIFGLGGDRDFLLLDDDRPNAKLTIQGDPPRFLTPQPATVTVRGGEYLLVPSLSGLRAIV